MLVTVWQISDLAVEYILKKRKEGERTGNPKKNQRYRHKKALEVIDASTQLKRQKRFVRDIVSAEHLSEQALTAYTQELLSQEGAYYSKCLSPTELMAKLGPMFGLLGTLIPLGPGIIALGKGDTAALSASIGVAFDTTIAGLISAAVCFVLSHIRRRWYANYMSKNEAIAECILEEVATANAKAQIEWNVAYAVMNEEGVNPLDSLGNLADLMLVLACGLMISIIALWNVDLSQAKTHISVMGIKAWVRRIRILKPGRYS